MPDKGTMTINQALKTRKVVDKRIASKVQESINLCCHSSVLKPAFENTPGRVKRLMQSAEDLIRYRGELDRAIVVANTAKKISFRGGEYTLLELLDLRGRGKDKNGLLRQKINFYSGVINQLDRAAASMENAAKQASPNDPTQVTAELVVNVDRAAVEEKKAKAIDLLENSDMLIEDANFNTMVALQPLVEDE